MSQRSVSSMVIGTILFVFSLAAWVYCAERDINTDILWAVVVPILTALFIGHQLGSIGENAQKAAEQTNGTLIPRVEAAVQTAMAKRDAARLYQSYNPTALVTKDNKPEGNHDDDPPA